VSASGLDVLEHVIRPAAGEPRGALVLMHGRGADRHDLLPVADALDPKRRLVVGTPQGPLQMDGMPGWHWYGPVTRVGYPDPETFERSYALLGEWLDAFAAEHGVPLERTVLGGFSQGTVMAYSAGLGRGRPQPAGLLAMSGFMPIVEGFELDLADRSGLPAMIEHGANDPVIVADWGRDARDRLTAAGATVAFHEHPGGHHIDPRRVPEMQHWIEDVLWQPQT
jgi:phospholipase/carboxylesterase